MKRLEETHKYVIALLLWITKPIVNSGRNVVSNMPLKEEEKKVIENLDNL